MKSILVLTSLISLALLFNSCENQNSADSQIQGWWKAVSYSEVCGDSIIEETIYSLDPCDGISQELCIYDAIFFDDGVYITEYTYTDLAQDLVEFKRSSGSYNVNGNTLEYLSNIDMPNFSGRTVELYMEDNLLHEVEFDSNKDCVTSTIWKRN